MTLALPDADATPAVWRRAAAEIAADPAHRDAALRSLRDWNDRALIALIPRWLFRSRGKPRLALARALAELAEARPVPVPLVYSAFGEYVTGAASIRPLAHRMLDAQRGEVRESIEAALSAAARFSWLRGAGAKEQSASASWRFTRDEPYGSLDPASVFRSWRDGRGTEPGLEAALALSTSNAPRSMAEQTRALIAHVLRHLGRASDVGVSLLRWLGEECDSVDDLPASVRLPGWRSTAAEALARTAIATAGPAATLRHLSAGLGRASFDHALLEAALRALLLDARLAPGDSSSALGDAVRVLAEALERVPAFDPALPRIIGLLLGREVNGALVGAGRWLTDDLRARVHAVALSHAPLGAHEIALSDLESGSIPIVLVPLLKSVALGAADPLIRERARRLARGEPR